MLPGDDLAHEESDRVIYTDRLHHSRAPVYILQVRLL